jgi:hypothetical protein
MAGCSSKRGSASVATARSFQRPRQWSHQVGSCQQSLAQVTFVAVDLNVNQEAPELATRAMLPSARDSRNVPTEASIRSPSLAGCLSKGAAVLER